MSHTLILTKILQGDVELTDEEYEDYKASDDKYYWLDAWFSDLDTVERSIEEL